MRDTHNPPTHPHPSRPPSPTPYVNTPLIQIPPSLPPSLHTPSVPTKKNNNNHSASPPFLPSPPPSRHGCQGGACYSRASVLGAPGEGEGVRGKELPIYVFGSSVIFSFPDPAGTRETSWPLVIVVVGFVQVCRLLLLVFGARR